MRKPAMIGCGLLAAALAAGCGASSSEDAVMKDSINLMNEMASIMESITDEKSAKEAEGKMKALEERGKALEKKMKEFPKEKLDALGKKYESEGKAAADRVGKAVMNAMMKGIKLGPKGLGGP
jgi:hypothetical protein